MSRLYPSQPILGIAAAILRPSAKLDSATAKSSTTLPQSIAAALTAPLEILLGRRANPPLAGQWSLPGGKLELGETVREGLAREVMEETGLEIAIGPLIDVIDSIFPDDDGRPRYHYVLVDFVCAPVHGIAQAASDATELCWAPLGELAHFKLTEKTIEIVAKAATLYLASDEWRR